MSKFCIVLWLWVMVNVVLVGLLDKLKMYNQAERIKDLTETVLIKAALVITALSILETIIF